MSDTPEHANVAVASAFVDELAARGVRHAVVCPGSRSTPLAVALGTHPDLRLWVQVDERSAAYFALGMARQLRAPVALLSTSGTAAANFHPAIIEASLSRIPLLALTADRPPELRDWGAAQTIDQIRLYSQHAKWFAEMPVPSADAPLVGHARATAARAVLTACSDPAGPVHLNFPFREPLLPYDFQPVSTCRDLFQQGRTNEAVTAAMTREAAADPETVTRLAALVARERRGIVVCGPGDAPALAEAVAAFGAASGYPVLVDALSGARLGPVDRSFLVDAYDAFLRVPGTADRLAADVVIRVGAVPTSKPLQQWLAMHPGRRHVVIDPGDPRDPAHLADWHVRAGSAGTLLAVAGEVGGMHRDSESGWSQEWRNVDRIARSAIEESLSRHGEPFEGRAAAEIAALLPEAATLVAGNSMPVRDVDTFVRGDRRQVRIVGNRGASGIDGVVSSALGVAAVDEGPVVALVGDLSFYHDMNGLLAARQHGIDATIVVLNNDGGGIFSFLPQAEQLDEATFERLFGTPIGLDIAGVARLYGASHERPRDWQAFRRAVCRGLAEPGLSIVELVTDRKQNVAQHRQVWANVAVALGAAPLPGA